MICADSPGAFCQITSLFHALVKMDSMVFSPLRHSGFGGPGLPALLARPPGRQKAKAPDDTNRSIANGDLEIQRHMPTIVAKNRTVPSPR